MTINLKNLHLKFTILFFLLLSLSLNVFVVEAAPFLNKKDKVLSKDSVIRILAIGNSFSEDAIEHYLYDLAKAGGYKVIIGNLYIGGAPLDLHVKNINEDKKVYDYRKIDVNGNKTKTPKTAISFALADEKWDYISLQQASGKSGLYETYVESLPTLYNYVKERTTNSNVKYIWHQTWAYAQNSTHKAFKDYGNNQMTMYKGIIDASSKVNNLARFDMVVPSGTAIQNARTSFFGDNLTRDGYHLNLYIGRYVASCTWYEAIFGESVIGNSFVPAKVSDYEAKMGQYAAHAAIKKPFKITKLKKFKEKK